MRSNAVEGGIMRELKWDYAGRKSAASRLFPDIPAYFRVMSFKKNLLMWIGEKRQNMGGRGENGLNNQTTNNQGAWSRGFQCKSLISHLTWFTKMVE
jgi:hypothetical protein